MATVEQLPVFPTPDRPRSRSRKLDVARKEGVKKLKEYVLYEITPTLPGWKNLPKPEGYLTPVPEQAPLAISHRGQVIKKQIAPIKKRLEISSFEPVWHQTVQDEMKRWMKEDLGFTRLQVRRGMKLVDNQMNQAVKQQENPGSLPEETPPAA